MLKNNNSILLFFFSFPQVKLNCIRRCVLLHYYPEDGTVEFRHYSVKAVPVGVSKAVKRLVQSKVPDLSNLNDISEFITR